jgi:hypothetical protein
MKGLSNVIAATFFDIYDNGILVKLFMNIYDYKRYGLFLFYKYFGR